MGLYLVDTVRYRHRQERQNDSAAVFMGRILRTDSLKPGFQLNATHATQPIALRALRKRKPQTTQAFEWLLR